MRAVVATRFGGPEVLVTSQVADPVAGQGQVVVGVSVADVLFVETQIRRGELGGYFNVEPPYVPGNGVAGQVISIGEGVDPGRAGRRVVAHTALPQRGGYAEQAVAAAQALIPVPDGLGEAAAGRIRPVIGQVFPLERAAGAHAAIEAREVLGKTLLLV
jgi:NADPH:quinone reductase